MDRVKKWIGSDFRHWFSLIMNYLWLFFAVAGSTTYTDNCPKSSTLAEERLLTWTLRLLSL